MAGCASTPGTPVTAGASTAVTSAPTEAAGAAATVDIASRMPDPAQAWFGPWTLARSGDRVCTVVLGARNAAGDYVARTRACVTVDLARIAFWVPTGEGIRLYDFERRPVVEFRRAGTALYEGLLGEARVTLWR
jgi:hypothetical protein